MNYEAELRRAKLIVLFAAACWLGALLCLLAGCQTISGIGEDLQAVGEWGQRQCDKLTEKD